MKNIKEVELFLFDMDGTVYIGDREIEGSFDALRELKKLGKKVCFFTNNSSRAASDYVARLHKMGYEATENDIYTSSMVTCEYIRDHYQGKTVYLLGNLKLAAEFEKYGIKLVDENPDLLVLGFDTSLSTTGCISSAFSSRKGSRTSPRTLTWCALPSLPICLTSEP